MKHVLLLRRAAAAALTLAGLAGAHASQSFQVDARLDSTAFSTLDAGPLDTGLVFAPGDAVAITASGTWSGGGCGDFVDPEGTTCYGNDPVTGFNYFSLVGRIGNGAWFRIGDSYTGSADASGDLFLAFLDSDSANNFGAVTAVVQTPSVPEPGSVALVLAGLGLLGVAARRRAG